MCKLKLRLLHLLYVYTNTIQTVKHLAGVLLDMKMKAESKMCGVHLLTSRQNMSMGMAAGVSPSKDTVTMPV